MARTVKSPNPAFAGVDVPLASTFMLSTKPGKEAYVEPVLTPSPLAGEGGAFWGRFLLTWYHQAGMNRYLASHRGVRHGV